MPIFLGEFFENLIKSGGQDITDDDKKVLQSESFKGVLPEDLAGKIQKGLIGVDAALNHPEIRTRIRGEALGTFDDRLKQFAKREMGWQDEQWREFRGNEKEKSAIEILPTLLEKVRDYGKEIGEKNSGLNANELRNQIKAEVENEFKSKLERSQKTIQDYEVQIQTLAKKEKEIEAVWQEKLGTYQTKTALSQMFGSLPLKDLGSVGGTVYAIKQDELIDKYTWKMEDGKLTPYSKQDPMAKVMDGHKILTADELLKKELAEYIDPNPKKTGNGSTTTPIKTEKKDSPARKNFPSFI